MNLELLQVGSRVKYATLCEAFGVEKKTGKSKQLQMKEFERYVKFEKEGTWFNILEIYEVAKEKIDGRTNQDKVIFKNGELDEAIIYAMSNELYFKRGDVETWHYNVMELAEEVGLISEYHKHIVNYPEQLAIIGMTEASSTILNDFSPIRNQILNACKHLKENETIIDYGYDVFICNEIETEGEATILKFRELTEKEREIIAECEEATVDYFNSHKGEFGYRGGDLESYSKIYKSILNPAIRSQLWNHCYDSCKKVINDYINHSRKLFIKANTESIAQVGNPLKRDTIEIVNLIYSARKVEQAKRNGEKTVKEMEQILNSKTGRGFGDVKRIKESEVRNKYGMSVDEAKELTEKSATMRNIAYTNNVLDKTPEEDKKQMETYIDCIVFKDSLYNASKSLMKQLAIVGVDSKGRSRGYTYHEKKETQDLMKFFSETETNVVESNCNVEVGDYTFKEFAELFNYATELKIYAEYKYNEQNGWIETYLVADGQYVKLITHTAMQVQYLALLVAVGNKKTAHIGHVNGESRKLIKQLTLSNQ